MGGDGNNTSGNLNGGKLLGTVPNVTLGGSDDYSDKGRVIPNYFPRSTQHLYLSMVWSTYNRHRNYTFSESH